jgi:hypothetical protein
MNLNLTNMWVTDEDPRILLAIWRFLLWVGTQWFWDRPALKSWLLGLCQKLLVLCFRSNSAICASLDSNPRVSTIRGPFLPAAGPLRARGVVISFSSLVRCHSLSMIPVQHYCTRIEPWSKKKKHVNFLDLSQFYFILFSYNDLQFRLAHTKKACVF